MNWRHARCEKQTMSHHHHDQRFADRDVEDAGASVLISHQSNNDNAESTPVAQQSTPVSKRKRDNDDATPPTKGHRTVSKNTNSNSVSVASTSAVAATTSSTKLSAEELDAAELAVRQTVLAHGCRSVDCYQQLNAIEEGSYGVVYRARDIATGVVYALKQVKMETTGEGFPVHALREISILIAQPHPNIVAVREMVVGNTLNKIYMVMEFVDHDIKALMDRMERMHTQFATSEVKCLMLQLLAGVAHLHDNWVIHRDLKTSNLLYSSGGILKIADLGLARQYGSPLKQYSPVVVTLWYRAPEVLLGAKFYSAPIDMWSVGCLFAEFLQHKPLFSPARSEIDLLDRMFKLLGTVTESQWPGLRDLKNYGSINFYVQPENKLRAQFGDISDAGLDLLNRMLTYDPSKRISAKDALTHAYFEEAPRAKSAAMMPTWPSTAAKEGK